MISIKEIVAYEPGKVRLDSVEYDENTLPAGHVLVKTLYSAISAGTECAWISGKSNNIGQHFPYRPGYSAVGEVIRVGSDVSDFNVGDAVVVPWSGHRSHTVNPVAAIRKGVHKISDSRVSLKAAAFTHIASFPMLGVRKLRLQMGESVMIAGLGILGQIALQAARYSGAAPLFGCDLSPERRELALRLGADAVFDPSEPDFLEKLLAANGGRKVNAVVEVTGKAIALKQALQYTAKMGRISLLGCTRVPDCPIDFYRDVHLPGITLIGAHTSNRPDNDSRLGAWTEHDDYEAILKYLATRRFDFESLIHKTVSPAECTQVYDMLLNDKHPTMGIVFDWSLLK